MIRALLWKEYREQRVIVVTLAFLTILAMTLMYQWKQSQGQGRYQSMNESALQISLGLAFLCGLVTGAMLLAGEEESRTQPFLDVLPAWRKGMWIGKLVFGIITIGFQVALICALIIAFGLIPERISPVAVVVALSGSAVHALAWGLFGSALCRNVLSAIGLALGGQLIAVLIGGVVVTIFDSLFLGLVGRANPIAAIAFAAVILVPFPIAGSLLIYARPDFRGSPSNFASPYLARQGRAIGTWRVMLWLVWRQGRTPFLILAGVCLATSLLVRVDGLVVWPVVSLIIGLVCGLAAFMGEQATGSEVFLGTERIPATRFWLYKVGLWSVFLVILAGLFWMVPVLRAGIWWSKSGHMEASGQVTESMILGMSPPFLSIIDTATFAGLWLLHGFAIGQVFALACRKTVVAGFLSIGACLAVAAFWLPSVLYGGLQFWQILGAPVILLIGSRLAYWPWIGNRLLTWRPIAILTACGVLGIMWIGSQLAYRAFEIPRTPQPINMAKFVAELPTAEKNVAGRNLEEAGKSLRRLREGASKDDQAGNLDREFFSGRNIKRRVEIQPNSDQGSSPGLAKEGDSDFYQLLGQWLGRNLSTVQPVKKGRTDFYPNLDRDLSVVVNKGWGKAKDREQLGETLDRLFNEDWKDSAQKVREASELPLAMLIDPTVPYREVKFDTASETIRIAHVFIARGRQFQAREDYDKALEHYFHALAVSRHMRNQAILMVFQRGLEGEGAAERALDSWQRDLASSKTVPDSKRLALLRQAIEGLTRHEAALPSLEDSLKAQYLVIRNMIYDPDALNDFMGSGNPSIALRLAGTARLMAVLPWEMNRVGRILDALFAGWERSLSLNYRDLDALLKEEAQDDHGQRRPSQPARNLLSAWSPPNNDANVKQARDSLMSLINQSWLREAIAPEHLAQIIAKSSAAGFSQLVLAVPYHLRSMRLLKTKLAIEAFRNSQENRSSPKSLQDLVPGLLNAVPIDPHTDKEFTQKDFRALMEQPKEEPESVQPRPGGKLRMMNDR